MTVTVINISDVIKPRKHSDRLNIICYSTKFSTKLESQPIKMSVSLFSRNMVSNCRRINIFMIHDITVDYAVEDGSFTPRFVSLETLKSCMLLSGEMVSLCPEYSSRENVQLYQRVACCLRSVKSNCCQQWLTCVILRSTEL